MHSNTYTKQSKNSSTSGSLTALRDRPVWVAWKEVERDGNLTKEPRDPKRRGTKAKSDDPSTWGTRAAAEKMADLYAQREEVGGVGVVFCELGDDTHLCGIDLDSCLDPKAGKLKPHAAEIVQRFDVAYAETSPSGKGLKLYFRVRLDHLPMLRKAMGRPPDGKPAHGK